MLHVVIVYILSINEWFFNHSMVSFTPGVECSFFWTHNAVNVISLEHTVLVIYFILVVALHN